MLLRILIIVAVVVVVVLAWDFLSQMIMPPSARGEIAANLVEGAAETIIERADGARFAILELEGDHEMKITRMLYDAAIEKDSAAVSGEIISKSDLGNSYPPSSMTMSNIGDDRRIQYLLIGDVEKYSQDGPNAEVEISLTLLDVESGDTEFHRDFEDRRKAGFLDSARYSIGSLNILMRLAGWCLVVALLPLVLLPLLRRGLEEESNVFNAFMLGGLTLAAGILAWLAVGYAMPILLEILILVAAVALAGIYNYWVLDRLAA